MIELNCTETSEETMRENLAMVMKIHTIEEIPNRDFIEKIGVGGYFGVAEKGIHSVGDWVVMFRYDAILPKREVFKFMSEFKYRVKFKKFRIPENPPIYSQIIIIPISEIEKDYVISLPREEEFECASILEVTKYVKPISGNGGSSFGKLISKGDFPTHLLSKTDEDSLQNYSKALYELLGKEVYISQKQDGSSATFLIDPITEEFLVCSRKNIICEYDTNLFWIVAKKYNIEKILREYNNIAIQGELVGPKIQGNKLGLNSVDLFVFNVIDLNERKRIPLNEQIAFCERNKLNHVPILGIFKNFNMTIQELLEFSDKEYYAGSPIEGIVIRPTQECYSPYLKGPLSVKVINPQFK